jgi:hypothetical protein
MGGTMTLGVKNTPVDVAVEKGMECASPRFTTGLKVVSTGMHPTALCFDIFA